MTHPSHAELDLIINHVIGERLTGRPRQDINVVSTVQNYRTGARMQRGARVYHYGHAGGVLVDNRIVFAANPQDAGMNAVAATGVAVAGVRTVTIVLAAGEGPAQDGNMPANYLEGGTIVFMTAAGIYVRGIISNTAVTGGAGGVYNVTLDAPTLGAIVATDSTEVISSKYADIVVGGDTVLGGLLSTGVGVPTLPTVDGDWLWIQTWGPVWTATDLTLSVGNNNRSGFVHGDGTIQDNAGSGNEYQRAGTVMANAIGGGQGAPFVNLELDP